MSSEKARKGVYTAVATPVTSDWRPDLPRFLAHCEWLLNNGCDGLAPLGTTGEANSFGLPDRLRIIEALAESQLSTGRMIIGVGSCSIEDAVQVSKQALAAGARGLLMLPPFYYKSPTEEGLYSFFAAVADRLSANKPRIYLYNFPQMSAVPITLSLVGRLRDSYPGIFVGLKDSSGVFENTKSFLDAFQGFEAFAGTETLAVRTLEAGGWGCISATANVTAPIVAERVNAGEGADLEELDRQIDDLRAAVSSFNNISGSKALLAEFRDDKAWARAVPPNVALTEDRARKLVAMIDDIVDLRKFFR